MKLYGTTTSPFVRRARVVAHEAGLSHELINTATEAGQALLGRVTPIRKVPVAEIDGRVLFDSRAIIEWITTTRGFGGLAPSRDHFTELNHVNAVDEALGSAVQVFYLARDKVEAPATRTKQLDRVGSIFDWLGGELAAGRMGRDLGLAELSLVCTLDWMEFRDVYPVARHDAVLGGLRAAYRDRPSLVATRPHA